MSTRALLEHKKPFDQLESAVLERHLARPDEVAKPVLDALRYVLNFAKLVTVRDEHGVDHDVKEALGTHAWKVWDLLKPRLAEEESTLWAAIRVLPELIADTRVRRDQLIQHFSIAPACIDREVTHRELVMALGGGGGSGYGYAGIFTLLHRAGIQPELIAGTSIGALLGLFRARTRQHDGARLREANKKLSWPGVFRLGAETSRYGLPATLRFHLRAAIGDFFRHPDGTMMTMKDMGIPFMVTATGLTVDALKHDLSYYENFLDEVVRPNFVFRASRLANLGRVAEIFKEFAQSPDALREVVFGYDSGTEETDCIDACGFSASVPGLLHYDVHRDDERMKHLLDALYAEHGITRLTEGGVVDNVPMRVAFEAAQRGRVKSGHRNVFVLGVDCFRPRPTSLIFYPLQQVARANVMRNIPYSNLYLPLTRVLNPANLVPPPDDVANASRWAMRDLEAHMPLLKLFCTPFPGLEGVH